MDVGAFSAPLDELSLSQNLQVLRGVRDRHFGFVCEFLNRAFPLGQKFQKLQPSAAGERLTDAGKLLIEFCLECSLCCLFHIQLVNQIVEYKSRACYREVNERLVSAAASQAKFTQCVYSRGADGSRAH